MRRVVLFLAFACALHVAVAEDSYLYWMIDNGGVADSWDSAKIHYTSAGDTPSDGYLYIYGDVGLGEIGPSVGYETVMSAQAVSAGLWAKLMSSPSATYVIELWKDQALVAQSERSYAYADLAEHIAKTGIAAPGGGMLMAMMVPTPVPEPSSGLLLLLGCAGLALRRRRSVKA